eukprot:3510132-Prymnesium_polylepis.1
MPEAGRVGRALLKLPDFAPVPPEELLLKLPLRLPLLAVAGCLFFAGVCSDAPPDRLPKLRTRPLSLFSTSVRTLRSKLRLRRRVGRGASSVPPPAEWRRKEGGEEEEH